MRSIAYKSKQAFAAALELPEDIVLNKPRITVSGENQVIIENHKGIVLFQDNMVRVNSESGLITINGTGFEILFMGGSTITIAGRFKSLVYEGI
jgi:sporulation protein YqfC